MSDYAPISSNNNGAALAAQLTPQIIWDTTFQTYEENSDFYASVEGTGPNSIILTKSDLSKGAGQTMTIRNRSGFYNEPHFGDSSFATDDDFEKMMHSEYSLTVDLIRHATSYTERAEELIGVRNEIRDGIPAALGEWLGRRKTEELDMMFSYQVPGENQFYPNGKTKNGLVKADGLSWAFVQNTAGALATMGGQFGRLGAFSKDNSPVNGLALVTCSEAANILRQDSTYLDNVKNAGIRGAMNPIFKGETAMIDGTMVVDRRIIDSDGEGAIGSPLNPKASLGVAVAAGTTALVVYGGGNGTSAAKTNKMYFKYFDGYAYKFSTGTTLSPASETRYLLIINPSTDATAPNKMNMYSYTTGNDGNKITTVSRLGSAAAGARVTTLGDVTYNSGVWTTAVLTETHPVGALILPCNSKGEPMGRSFLLGRAAALRGYGKYRGRRTTETADGGVMQRTYIQAYLGQKLRIDRLSRCPGVAVLNHSLHYPHLPLPVIV